MKNWTPPREALAMTTLFSKKGSLEEFTQFKTFTLVEQNNDVYTYKCPKEETLLLTIDRNTSRYKFEDTEKETIFEGRYSMFGNKVSFFSQTGHSKGNFTDTQEKAQTLVKKAETDRFNAITEFFAGGGG